MRRASQLDRLRPRGVVRVAAPARTGPRGLHRRAPGPDEARAGRSRLTQQLGGLPAPGGLDRRAVEDQARPGPPLLVRQNPGVRPRTDNGLRPQWAVRDADAPPPPG